MARTKPRRILDGLMSGVASRNSKTCCGRDARHGEFVPRANGMRDAGCGMLSNPESRLPQLRMEALRGTARRWRNSLAGTNDSPVHKYGVWHPKFGNFFGRNRVFKAGCVP